jgi:polysaccharide pyruvyl transferase WcaK-like protein
VEPVNLRGAPRVLLVGYNGANNTGSEARLLAIIDDVREVFGPGVRITVPTLNERNLRRYVEEGPDLRIEPIPSIFFFALRRLVREHDIVMLVEGSCYMDTWTPALLWAFLWATRCAHSMGKPSLAYAVDAGRLSKGNQERVRREASKTDLIITRTQAAADLLRSWGVTAPMEVTADNAFYFRVDPSDGGLLRRTWPEASSGVVGMALVDFYLWPVVIRPWGRAEDRYRWPYYFSRSEERRRAARGLAEGFAAEADRIVEEHDRSVALIAMEELDTPLVLQTLGLMAHPDKARVFSSGDYNASQMTSVLRGLDLLVSSRYHACVMSMAAGVPMVAVGHDLRIEGLFRDLGLYEGLFIPHDREGLFPLLGERVDRLISDPGPTREAILRGHGEHMERALRNRELLRAFAAGQGWGVMG